MTKDEALKMAIEALDTLMMEKGSIYQQALEACKDALEQPAQEPVAWMSEGGVFTRTKEHAESWSNHGGKVTPVYTHPAPSWHGLSDDEIHIICAKMAAKLPNKEIDLIFARAIEQALKEKNNGTT